MISMLRESLETGFLDRLHPSNFLYQPKLITNNKTYKKKILTTIIQELNSCEEFIFSVAFLSRSGVATLINTLEGLEEKGVKGKILVSQYLNFTQPEALKTMMKFKNIELRIVTKGDFHAKGYFFKHATHYTMIVGSSNLTAPALTKNKEWNLYVCALSDSKIIQESLRTFYEEYNRAQAVDEAYIKYYERIYKHQGYIKIAVEPEAEGEYGLPLVNPNEMQVDAMRSLDLLRNGSETSKPQDKALIISATGTGKTYLSVFDVQNVNPKRMLFVVHRKTIANAAMDSYKTVFGSTRTMGVFSGNRKEVDKDFVFCTIQTLAKEDNLRQFDPDTFDYIVIDETHRAGAETYQKIISYFEPEFLLGMTATPERTDGYDIFKTFDHNIAYEIRLNEAIDGEMLCPFHYYGITDLYVEDKEQEELSFNSLTNDARVDHILERAAFYGTDSGDVRGLVFCDKKTTCIELSKKFNAKGYKTVALTGESSETERENAIRNLESTYSTSKLDYIFTVDIFNEGIDIPKVNQIIMLRPTKSAIIFVQQLGRGLRKTEDKEYLTVIDFIGNYNNNFLIPIALYGDLSYSKDNLRKFIAGGSIEIPGCSTVNFDRVAKERIYQSIDSARMSLKKDLDNDYKLLKYKLGRVPMMMDFVEHGSRDPKLYVNYSKSFFNYLVKAEDDFECVLNEKQIKILEYIALHVADGKRPEELLILKRLLQEGILNVNSIGLKPELLSSAINNLNFRFVNEKENKKLIPIGEKYDISMIDDDLLEKGTIRFTKEFSTFIQCDIFKSFIVDSIEYGLYSYNKDLHLEDNIDGFILYRKYSRKDVFRILCWDNNPVAQNVGGYIISPDSTNCPAFVNYHKEDDISETIKYEDKFISQHQFQWMSKSNRSMKSNDVQKIKTGKGSMRIPLFIKKHNDEGDEFYFLGDIEPIEDSFEELRMPAGNNKTVSVVKIQMAMKQPVDQMLYEYITNRE